jgi:hypothetical protein
LLTGLDFPPGDRWAIPKNVRVTTNHLFFKCSCHRLGIKGLSLFGQDNLKGQIQEQVSELILQGHLVSIMDGSDDLPALFQ